MQGNDLLITGVSGMLGANLALDLRETRKVVGVYHSRPVRLEGVDVHPMDLAIPGEAERILQRFRPETVIHCAALTNVDFCEENPDRAMEVNARATERMARACRVIGARLVYISTDAVFSGRTGGYTEADEPEPANAYGHSKLVGERLALESWERTLVLRTNIFGLGLREGHGLAEWMLSKARQGSPFTGFTDSVFAPVLVNALGRIALALLEQGRTGIWHAAGEPALSKYEFARGLLRRFGLDMNLAQAGSVSDVAFRAKRPLNSFLDGSRLRAALPEEHSLGMEQALEELHKLHDSGRDRELKAAGGIKP